MPVYKLQGPDGRVYSVEGPENATAEQLGAFITSQMAPKQAHPAAPKAEDPGVLGTLMIGAGRGTDQILKGAQQLFYKATGNDQALQGMAERQAADDAAYNPLKEMRPWATSIGESLPNMALLTGTGGGGAALVARGALAGAAPEAIKYGTADERLRRGAAGAIGGGLGAAAGLGVARLIRPTSAATVQPTVLEAAERLGYQPTAGQLTQNAALMNLENYLSRSPGASGKMQANAAVQQQALNRAAARSMGETADNLGEGVMASAQRRIGDEFQRLQQITRPQLGDDFLNAVAKVDSANALKGPFASPQVNKTVEKALDLAEQGKLTGTAYKEIRTGLSDASQSAFSAGDAATGRALRDIRSALDDAAQSSLSAADKKAWGEARQQWGAFKTLTKGTTVQDGNVSAARVAAQMRAQGPALRTGAAQGELADIARIGEAFKSAQNPNSGGLVHSMMFGNPVTGLPLAAGNRLLAEAYMSPIGQQYFTQGLLSIGPKTRAISGRAGGLLGAPTASGLLGVE